MEKIRLLCLVAVCRSLCSAFAVLLVVLFYDPPSDLASLCLACTKAAKLASSFVTCTSA